MKKMFYSAVIALALTSSVFAKENAEINPKFEKNTNNIVCIRLTNEMSKKPSSLAVEMQYYDITCYNGAKAHKAFASLQAALDWGIEFCSPKNQ
jgi:hypothetical protein